jgi:hypothetical protein
MEWTAAAGGGGWRDVKGFIQKLGAVGRQSLVITAWPDCACAVWPVACSTWPHVTLVYHPHLLVPMTWPHLPLLSLPPPPHTHLSWHVPFGADRAAGGWQPQVADASCPHLVHLLLEVFVPATLAAAVPAKTWGGGGGRGVGQGVQQGGMQHRRQLESTAVVMLQRGGDDDMGVIVYSWSLQALEWSWEWPATHRPYACCAWSVAVCARTVHCFDHSTPQVHSQ